LGLCSLWMWTMLLTFQMYMKMEEAGTTDMSAKLTTSTRCKDPKETWTMNHHEILKWVIIRPVQIIMFLLVWYPPFFNNFRTVRSNLSTIPWLKHVATHLQACPCGALLWKG
jgi:hypothetical protein